VCSVVFLIQEVIFVQRTVRLNSYMKWKKIGITGGNAVFASNKNLC